MSEPSTSRCEWCGVSIGATSKTCAHCQGFDSYPQPGPKDALTGGAWRFDPFRRVQVWVAA